MTVKTQFSDENILTIAVEGKFDFGLLTEFRRAYSNDYGNVGRYVVDMRSTNSMDSSALGMLLNMKKYLQRGDREIRIINCNPILKKILLIAIEEKSEIQIK